MQSSVMRQICFGVHRAHLPTGSRHLTALMVVGLWVVFSAWCLAYDGGNVMGGEYIETGAWSSSGLLGYNLSRSRWTQQHGASITYRPNISVPGKVRVFIYRIVHTQDNDPEILVEVQDATGLYSMYLDLTYGRSGWLDLGIYDFDGTGQEYVRLTRVTRQPGIVTRADAVRFDLLADDGTEVLDQVIVDYEPHVRLRRGATYDDIADHWAQADITYLAERGLLQDRSGSFDPDQQLTVGDLATWLVQLLLLDLYGPNALADVQAEADPRGTQVWYAEAAGLFAGLPSELHPYEAVTWQELSLVFTNALRYSRKVQFVPDMLHQSILDGMSGLDGKDHATIDSLAQMVAIGALDAVRLSDDILAQPVTRAEAAVAFRHLYETVVQGPPTDSPWELAFADEFNAEGIDWRTWQSSRGGQEVHIRSTRWPDNVEVQDGMLRLITKHDDPPGTEWTTASVWTSETFQYGYFEARFRYSDVESQDVNHAFWLFSDARPPYVNQPYLEIDINEGRVPNIILTALHGSDDGRRWNEYEVHYVPYDLRDDFHVYGLEWNERELIWYFDGVEIRRREHDSAFDPVRVYFSTALMHESVDEELENAHGTSMDVDWVRVYRRKNLGAFTSVYDGAEVSGLLPIQLDFDESRGFELGRVSIWLDDALLYEGTGLPKNLAIDTWRLHDGPHRLSAQIEIVGSESERHDIQFLVNNIGLRVSGPMAEPGPVSGLVPVDLELSIGEEMVERVFIAVDDLELYCGTAIPNSLTLDTLTLEDGLHHLQIEVSTTLGTLAKLQHAFTTNNLAVGLSDAAAWAVPLSGIVPLGIELNISESLVASVLVKIDGVELYRGEQVPKELAVDTQLLENGIHRLEIEVRTLMDTTGTLSRLFSVFN